MNVTNGFLPRINELHLRHKGVSIALCAAYGEAAAVSLSRCSTSPTEFSIASEDRFSVRNLEWTLPDDQQRRAWANATDRVEFAAYGVSLAAVEAEFGLLAVHRMPTLTGADYYLEKLGDHGDLLESACRLEVSGVESAEPRRVNERVRRKSKQVYHPIDPSLVSVVSFGARRIILRRV